MKRLLALAALSTMLVACSGKKDATTSEVNTLVSHSNYGETEYLFSIIDADSPKNSHLRCWYVAKSSGRYSLTRTDLEDAVRNPLTKYSVEDRDIMRSIDHPDKDEYTRRRRAGRVYMTTDLRDDYDHDRDRHSDINETRLDYSTIGEHRSSDDHEINHFVDAVKDSSRNGHYDRYRGLNSSCPTSIYDTKFLYWAAESMIHAGKNRPADEVGKLVLDIKGAHDAYDLLKKIDYARPAGHIASRYCDTYSHTHGGYTHDHYCHGGRKPYTSIYEGRYDHFETHYEPYGVTSYTHTHGGYRHTHYVNDHINFTRTIWGPSGTTAKGNGRRLYKAIQGGYLNTWHAKEGCVINNGETIRFSKLEQYPHNHKIWKITVASGGKCSHLAGQQLWIHRPSFSF